VHRIKKDQVNGDDSCESSDEEKVEVKLSPRRREAKKLRKERRRTLRDK
jgi:hypothetical protein